MKTIKIIVVCVIFCFALLIFIDKEIITANENSNSYDGRIIHLDAQANNSVIEVGNANGISKMTIKNNSTTNDLTKLLVADDSVEELEEGVYSDGKTLYLNTQVKKELFTNAIINSIYNSEINTFPTKVWSWSDGIYSSNLIITDYIYIDSLFTGINELNTEIKCSHNINSINNCMYTVYLITDKNDLIASYQLNDTSISNIHFYNLNPNNQYSFMIKKENCDSNTNIKVKF